MKAANSDWKASVQKYMARHGRTRWALAASFLALIPVGWVYPQAGYWAPVCMLGGLLPAFFWGRRWCGQWCPRGSFLERFVEPVSGSRPVPPVLRSLAFRLFAMAVLFTVFGVRISMLWPDPLKIGGFFVMFLTITTAVGVALGLIYKPRTWCGFCPIGTMASWASVNKYPVRVAADCSGCGACENACPLGIKPHEYKEAGAVCDADCLKCRMCVVSCPQQSLTLGASGVSKVA